MRDVGAKRMDVFDEETRGRGIRKGVEEFKRVYVCLCSSISGKNERRPNTRVAANAIYCGALITRLDHQGEGNGSGRVKLESLAPLGLGESGPLDRGHWKLACRPWPLRHGRRLDKSGDRRN